jgi:hypothetical protein
MDLTFETMLNIFAQRQLHQAIVAGQSFGLAPVTTAATIMQAAANLLVSVSPTHVVAMLRAFADVIEAGPGTGPAQAQARAGFEAAAQGFIEVARASADFPTPQGTA